MNNETQQKTVSMGVRMSVETLELIKVKAQRSKRTVNQWINKAIQEKLDK